MTACDKCGHGAAGEICANPECLEGMGPVVGLWYRDNDRSAIEKFTQFLTPSGLWLWVLDTGRAQ